METASKPQDPLAEFKLKLILPFSKKEVEITCPSWADRKRAKASARNIEGDNDEFLSIMLAGCTKIDGKEVESPEAFDALLSHDMAFIIESFGNWKYGEGKVVKN